MSEAENGMQEATVDFPEGHFPPRRERAAAYAQCVRDGYQNMRKLRPVICGLARDIQDILPINITRIERLGKLFGDYRVVVYENDSRDDTPQILEAWSQVNPKVDVLFESRRDPVNPATRCLERVGRMAYYRNQYRRHVQQHYADFSHAIVIDLDLFGGWSLDGVAHTFGQPDWDFVGAYGIIYRRVLHRFNVPFQYDAWAYRHLGRWETLRTKEVNHLHWQRGDDMVPVNSCFGGFGIYAMNAFLSADYGHRGDDIEHVVFHRGIRAQGYDRMFINPNLLALYGRKHRKLDHFFYSLHRTGILSPGEIYFSQARQKAA